MAKSKIEFKIDETTPGLIEQAFQANDRFIVLDDSGYDAYVGIMFSAERAGWKSIAQAEKNIGYGRICEQIKGNLAHVYNIAGISDHGEILFIPDKSTLDCLEEQHIFKNHVYEFVKVSSEDMTKIIHTGVMVDSLATLRNILEGLQDITDFVKNTNVIQAGSREDPTKSKVEQAVDNAKEAAAGVTEKISASGIADKAKDTAKSAAAGVKNLFDNVRDKVSGGKNKDDKSSEPVPASTPEPVSTDIPDAPSIASVSVSAPAAPAPAPVPETAPEPEEDITYTENQVYQTVNVIYHGDDLNLPITTAAFDQMFVANNRLITFNTDQHDGYVNAELNRIAADANRDIMKLHEENLSALRKEFLMAVQMEVEKIGAQLDIKNPETKYGKQKMILDQYREQQKSDLAPRLQRARDEIEQKYDETLNAFKEQAEANARAKFMREIDPQKQNELQRAEAAVMSTIDAEWNEEMNRLLAARRTEAFELKDQHENLILQVLAKKNEENIALENQLYQERADYMREYSKQLHIDDAKRLAVEEEHLRITNEVNDARAEAAAKIQLIQNEFETANKALEARYEAAVKQAETERELLTDQMNNRTSTLEQDKSILQGQLNESMERADRAQELAKSEYEHRLTQAADDKEQWRLALENYREQHKHNNKLAAILVVAIVIACLAGGFVAGGVYWNKIVNKSDYTPSNNGSYEIKVLKPEGENDQTGLASGDVSADADLVKSVTELKSRGRLFDPVKGAFVEVGEFNESYKADMAEAKKNLPDGLDENTLKTMHYDPIGKTYLTAEGLVKKYNAEITKAVEDFYGPSETTAETIVSVNEITEAQTEAEKPAETEAEAQ